MPISDIFEHIRHLRDPENGCPWDRKQTFSSFAECIESEAEELAEAMRAGDHLHMREEAGDLLWTLAFVVHMADEEKAFNLSEVVAEVVEKMRRRHPHVFGESTASTPEEALASFRAAKAKEKSDRASATASKSTRLIDVAAWYAAVLKHIPSMMAGDAFAVAQAEAKGPFEEALWRNVAHNATLWGFEDQVRRPDLPDSEIARFKRLIDRENQGRNDAIDETDAALVALVNTMRPEDPLRPLNTETPGSVFDRLSIIALRVHHLDIEIQRTDATPDHTRACAEKRAHVQERAEDLIISLQKLLSDILGGRLRIRCYNQHKLYNDPTTNPAVRSALQAMKQG